MSSLHPAALASSWGALLPTRAEPPPAAPTAADAAAWFESSASDTVQVLHAPAMSTQASPAALTARFLDALTG
jgi:hypothetical protein